MKVIAEFDYMPKSCFLCPTFQVLHGDKWIAQRCALSNRTINFWEENKPLPEDWYFDSRQDFCKLKEVED